MKRIILLLLLSISTLYSKEDSLKTYEIGDIISTGRGEKQIKSTTIKKVYKFELETTNATSLSDMETVIPSSNIVTNSRGESLIYLRGAGDRQTGLFLNGAMLNIPWDNRMDLSLIPSSIVGSINVSNSTGSILYGANSMGGALNITTEEYSSEGLKADLNYQFTEGNNHLASTTLKSSYDNLNFIFNINYTDNQNSLVAANIQDSLLYNNNRGILRNSDLNRFGWFGSMGYKIGKKKKSEIGLSYFGYSSDKGISPEHNVPQIENARFWRYDEIIRNMAIVNGRLDFDNSNFNFAYWADGFQQDILDFTNQTYNEIDEIEAQEDLTFGMRNKYEYEINDKSILSLFLIASSSNHTNNGTLEFQQELATSGLEFSRRTKHYSFTTGIAYDIVNYSKAGQFVESEGKNISDYSYNIGMKRYLNNDQNIFFNHSRKTRFPTMREQFDGALGRFQVNPDLKAETAYNFELGTSLNSWTYRYNINAAIFLTKFDDLIIRRSLENSPLRTRANLNEALVYGFELNGKIKPFRFLSVNGQFTYMFSEGSSNDETIELEYKPRLKGIASVDYDFNQNIQLLAELDYEGEQYGINDAIDGRMDILDPTTYLNFKFNYKHYGDDVIIDLFVRLNNISDEVRFNKFGIPDQGRRLITGVNFKL